MVTISEDDYLRHYGMPRRSGRYPWGSTGNEGTPNEDYQISKRNMTFLDAMQELKSKGLSDTEIARAMGLSTGEFRAQRTVANNERKQARIHQAEKLSEKGVADATAARMMGIAPSTYRDLLAPGAREKAARLLSVANMLEDEVNRKEWVDVGAGVEHHLGISAARLKSATEILKQRGYEVHPFQEDQVSTKLPTDYKVLALPGTTKLDAFKNREKLQQIDQFSIDGGKVWVEPYKPKSISPSRVAINYREDGGHLEDGVLYVRPGVEDVSLGTSRYAQVRVKVGNTHYIKGMAVYKDNLPAGVDILFNTNKSREEAPNKLDALKKLKDDEDLPFGALTKPIAKDGETKPYSVMNIVNEEGSWQTWSRSLSTQMVSKQSPTLAKELIKKTQERKEKELKEIQEMTNPAVKRKLLMDFAEDTDAAAIHLKVAKISERQAWHVILPVTEMKETEVYAPGYENGERVALIRYPHGGTFEIPDLIVNNKNRAAKTVVGANSPDAIGISPKVAERLSGADFDGDTVLVIPNNSGKVKSTKALEDLVDFEPRVQYKAYPGMKVIKDFADPKSVTQKQMGDISNLITDMTIRNAPAEHLVRAVKHSMVVIDAEKHDLNYKQSAIDNGIAALKKQYQSEPTGGETSGASTLISRAKADVRIDKRKARPAAEGGPIDLKTGERVFVPSTKTRKLKDGTRVPIREKVPRLALTNDAHDLSSGTIMEGLYADHSNKLRSMANQARLDMLATPRRKMSPTAKKVYAPEVESLNAKLRLAQMNAPRERQANIIANTVMRMKRQANPNMPRDLIKRHEAKALENARKITGAGRNPFPISESEWEAIQAGAISETSLTDMLRFADMEEVKKLAAPKPQTLMTSSKTAKAKSLLAQGNLTRAEVAAILGVSVSTLDRSTTQAE